MPKLSYETTRQSLAGDSGKAVVVLSLEGFIDAANYLGFEKALERSAGLDAQFLIVDFSKVRYINSTGISALIRNHELYRDRGGVLCLAGVSKPVGLSMHLLGLTSLIPFLKDLSEAQTYVGDFAAGKIEEAPPSIDDLERGAPSVPKARRKVFLRVPKEPGISGGRVLVITPSESRFTRVLRMRFRRLNGGYHLLHDAGDALRRYSEINPDLVVVDDRCDPKGEFVSRLKVQKERSLTSVIKLYEKATDVQGSVDFKIWENDFLIDPFEVLEFFSLTEAELERVPKDRKVFYQQVHFEFRTTPRNVDKAYQLSDLIIRGSLENEEDATALYAAVKEGIDNAVVHGNRSSPEKKIDVNFLVDQKKTTVLIEDEGAGFDFEYYLSKISVKDAFEDAKKRILKEGIRGGLGILLMSRCTNRIEYSGLGNILRLEKNSDGR